MNEQRLKTYTDDIINCLYRRVDGAKESLDHAITQFPKAPMLHILACITVFFSCSRKVVENEFEPHLYMLKDMQLNEQNAHYYQALEAMVKIDFTVAFSCFEMITQDNPTDRLSILMLETLGFLGGLYEKLTPIYQRLLKEETNRSNPDFLGMVAFLYCHTNQSEAAKKLIKSALNKAPHNAWLQHVYVHTLDNATTLEKTQVTPTTSANLLVHTKSAYNMPYATPC